MHNTESHIVASNSLSLKKHMILILLHSSFHLFFSSEVAEEATIMTFIYINGYPGVGKLTVAEELKNIIPLSEVIDNHSLIDPVAREYERWMPEYYPMRKKVVTHP